MLYSILRFLVKSLLGLYFKRIHILGIDNLPKDKPVILACNHPSSFMEAILLACYLPRELHFLVRGDVFRNKLLRWLLKKTHQIPIFRLRDGMAKLRNNSNTFRYCYSAFRKNAMIIIFSESTTQLVKRLRPLHRGTWRLAYNAIEDNPSLELQIVPVGINFSEVDKFRSDVIVSIAQSLDVKKIISDSHTNKRDTIQSGTSMLRSVLKKQIIHFDDDLSEQLGDPFLKLIPNNLVDDQSKNSVHQNFLVQQKFALDFSKLNIEQKKLSFQKLNQYLSHIEHNIILDKILINESLNKSKLMKAIIVIIPGFIGFIFNFLPFWTASKIRRNIVKYPEFYAPIRIGLWMIFQVIFYLILFFILYHYFGIIAIIVIVMPFLMRFSVELFELFEHNRGYKLMSSIKTPKNELLDERKMLFSFH